MSEYKKHVDQEKAVLLLEKQKAEELNDRLRKEQNLRQHAERRESLTERENTKEKEVFNIYTYICLSFCMTAHPSLYLSSRTEVWPNLYFVAGILILNHTI